jgi:hypothetical protein
LDQWVHLVVLMAMPNVSIEEPYKKLDILPENMKPSLSFINETDMVYNGKEKLVHFGPNSGLAEWTSSYLSTSPG